MEQSNTKTSFILQDDLNVPVKKAPLKQRLMQPDSKIEISVPTLLAFLAFVGMIAAGSAIAWVCYHTFMAYKLYLGF